MRQQISSHLVTQPKLGLRSLALVCWRAYSVERSHNSNLQGPMLPLVVATAAVHTR
jgi:hypothetical protein